MYDKDLAAAAEAAMNYTTSLPRKKVRLNMETPSLVCDKFDA